MLKISGKEGRPYSILFRGCSFLVIYEAGVLSALQDLSPDIMKSAYRIYGSSSGSVIATAGLFVHKEQCKGYRMIALLCFASDEMKEYVLSGLKTSLWGFIPGGRILRILRGALRKILPPNAHELVSGKLHIVLTRVHDWRTVTVSEFASKEELIQAVTCSCFIPLYFGFCPPTYRGVVSSAVGWRPCPTDFVSRTTITISAFAGEYDICPKDGPAAFLTFQLLLLQVARATSPLQQPSCPDCHLPPQAMDRFYIQGYQDTVSFLKRLSK
uniref:Uncharacterized protein n=1 Tax=Corvus moneduloides TaxID=1196302 RepID=A0A8U7NT69_CORMO